MTISGRIKQRREELGMTQQELAIKLGYKSRSSINKIEKDSHGLPRSKVVEIAKALETTPSYIMGWQEEKLTPITPAFTLSPTEMQLIADYRTLTKEGKEYIDKTMKFAKTEYTAPNEEENLAS